jgi:general stress protein YciG
MACEQKQKRGFALMDPAKRRAIAKRGGRLGGLAAQASGKARRWTWGQAVEAALLSQASGKAHKFTSEEARAAGRKGGMAKRKKKAVKQ